MAVFVTNVCESAGCFYRRIPAWMDARNILSWHHEHSVNVPSKRDFHVTVCYIAHFLLYFNIVVSGGAYSFSPTNVPSLRVNVAQASQLFNVYPDSPQTCCLLADHIFMQPKKLYYPTLCTRLVGR